MDQRAKKLSGFIIENLRQIADLQSKRGMYLDDTEAKRASYEREEALMNFNELILKELKSIEAKAGVTSPVPGDDSLESVNRKIDSLWRELSTYFDSKYSLKEYLGDSDIKGVAVVLPRNYVDKDEYVKERTRLKERVNELMGKIESRRALIKESTALLEGVTDEAENEILRKRIGQCSDKLIEYEFSLQSARYNLMVICLKTPVDGKSFYMEIQGKCLEYLRLLERRADLLLAELAEPVD